ncbi:MAG: prepilin-type N-terminal cleavage/methylation domain-containing protein [Desulfomonilia bacterium]|jgi:prepilin-type N-terminal cleavage/methylation domain-containing protein
MRRTSISCPSSGKKGGFTLIELVVAILVFSLGILGIAKLQSMAVQGNAYSMHFAEGMSVAQNTIERLMDLPMTSNSLGGAADLTTPFAWTTDPVRTQRNMEFTTRWLVSQVGTLGLRQVDVEVSWNEKDSDHSITISFIKGR